MSPYFGGRWWSCTTRVRRQQIYSLSRYYLRYNLPWRVLRYPKNDTSGYELLIKLQPQQFSDPTGAKAVWKRIANSTYIPLTISFVRNGCWYRRWDSNPQILVPKTNAYAIRLLRHIYQERRYSPLIQALIIEPLLLVHVPSSEFYGPLAKWRRW